MDTFLQVLASILVIVGNVVLTVALKYGKGGPINAINGNLSNLLKKSERPGLAVALEYEFVISGNSTCRVMESLARLMCMT